MDGRILVDGNVGPTTVSSSSQEDPYVATNDSSLPSSVGARHKSEGSNTDGVERPVSKI